MEEKIIKKYDTTTLDRNEKIKYNNVAIGSILCLSALINRNDLDFAVARAEYLLNIDKNDYYNQFAKTVNTFIQDYINGDHLNYMSGLEDKLFISCWSISLDNIKYELLINKDNLNEIVIAVAINDNLLIETNKEQLKEIIYLMAREITITLE